MRDRVEPLGIDGAWVVTLTAFEDHRGRLSEWFRADAVRAAVGRDLTVAQANHSVSRRDVLRGLHFADVPPGQAKYVYCTAGAVLDVAVDVRVGSPTFGRAAAVRLDQVDRRAVYLAEGLAHGFLVLSDEASLTYLLSSPYDPATERGVHPLDPALGLDWPTAVAPVLSEKDAAAPTLAAAHDAGLLPDYASCRAVYDGR